MNRYEPGSRVRLIRSSNGIMTGSLAWVLSGKYEALHADNVKQLGYDLDIDGYGIKSECGCTWHAPEDWLEPVYDGNEKISWDECIWKPKSHATT